jgi:monoamine oxidase
VIQERHVLTDASDRLSASSSNNRTFPGSDEILDLAIIGGGLAGLSLARSLLEIGRGVTVFEARERFGGRILSLALEAQFRYDMGPGWIWPELQPRLTQFIVDHGINIYPQWSNGLSLYHSDRLQQPQVYQDDGVYRLARRIQGGAQGLIDVFLQALPPGYLYSGHRLLEVIQHQDYVELCFEAPSGRTNIKARQVVMTIPPRLLIKTVKFTPELDAGLCDVMLATPTWMAGHAKAVIRYRRAFWREAGFSGSALAVYQGAALAEIFDASAENGDYAALSGFFALPAVLRRQYRDDLQALILEQLVRLFGKEAAVAEAIHIKDWCDDTFTATQEDEQLPSGHPQYGHARLQQTHWNNKLYFGGTETASEFGGYLEGALESSERLVSLIMNA